MCWSGEASLVLATLGFSGAGFEFYKEVKANKLLSKEEWYLNKHLLRGVTLAYFSLMELLQGVNYAYLDVPGPMNALCALLGFVHISFQPIFISWFMLSFIPISKRRFWFPKITGVSILATLVMLSRLLMNPLLPGCFSLKCIPVTNMFDIGFSSYDGTVGCASDAFKSYVGNWHIAWQWVLNNCHQFFYLYAITSFIFPLFYGAWRIMVYVFICGPSCAFFLTNNPDEWAAIWCLLSIAFLLAVKIPVIERLLTAKNVTLRPEALR